MSLRTLPGAGESQGRLALADLYAPIAAELAEAERIFAAELASRFPFVQQLVDHCADFRGKRLRPALVLLAGQACGGADAGAPRARGGRRDDPHGHARPRRHPRRGDDPPPRRDGQRRVGQRDGRPAGRLPLHPRLPPGRLARIDPRLPLDRPRDQPRLRGRDAAGPQPGQPRPRRGRVLRHHPGQDRRADRRRVPAGGRTTPARPRPPSRRSTTTAATWASPSRSPTTCSTSGARSGRTGKSLGTDLEKQKLTLPLICLLRLLEPAAAARDPPPARRGPGRSPPAAPARPRAHRRPRLRLAPRQAPREAGARRPRLPPRVARQGGPPHPRPVRRPALVLTSLVRRRFATPSPIPVLDRTARPRICDFRNYSN